MKVGGDGFRRPSAARCPLWSVIQSAIHADKRIHTQGPPKALDEDAVDAAGFSVYRDACARPFQPVDAKKGR